MDHILEAVSLAESQLGKWWGTAPHLVVTTVKKDRVETKTSLEDLERLDGAALGSFEEISIRLYREGVPESVRVTLRKRTPAVRIEVAGADETGVGGLLGRLSELMGVSACRPLGYRRVYALVAAVVLLGVLAILHSSDLVGLPVWAWTSSYGGISILGLGTFLLTPEFQVVPKGEKTRFGRFWGLLVGALALYGTLLGIYSFYFRND